MNILLVDGNEKETSSQYHEMGMDTQYEVFYKILKKLSKNNLNITTIHPAIKSHFLPNGLALDDFDGVVWTGSTLNIYNNDESIIRQIELARDLLNKKNSIFVSCWGLQVLVTAAGGKIRKNPNGLEAIVAKDINLNQQGLEHPMYLGKKKKFDAFCFHYDETELLPPNSQILASNQKSKIQAVCFENINSKVWAVQYHPEFDPIWMSGLMDQREEILLNEGIYNNKVEFDAYRNYFSNFKERENIKNSLSICENLSNPNLHSLELYNWINSLHC